MLDQSPHKSCEVGPSSRRLKRSAINQVNAVNASEMDKDVASISTAKDEPWVAFIRQAARGLKLSPRLNERAFHTIELREFLLRPVTRAWRGSAKKGQNLRDHLVSKRAIVSLCGIRFTKQDAEGYRIVEPKNLANKRFLWHAQGTRPG